MKKTLLLIVAAMMSIATFAKKDNCATRTENLLCYEVLVSDGTTFGLASIIQVQ